MTTGILVVHTDRTRATHEPLLKGSPRGKCNNNFTIRQDRKVVGHGSVAANQASFMEAFVTPAR
jgi:hypothetical protein